jgi:hypothetical protein
VEDFGQHSQLDALDAGNAFALRVEQASPLSVNDTQRPDFSSL